jgi:D-alanyl-D-alanine carboxypeptidase
MNIDRNYYLYKKILVRKFRKSSNFKLMTGILTLILPVFFVTQTFGQEISGNKTLGQKVDNVANQVLKSTGVPSASVAVVQHGKIVYTQAYGSAKLNPQVAATTDMRYAIGSISKQFTAACILILEQEGKISLDDHVSKWFPGFTRSNEVTIRELLSHTSGYQDFWPQDYVPPMMQKPIKPIEILNRWAKKPLDFDPGTRWQYSNTNFVIAGQIVQKITNEPFFKFLKNHILEPLQMNSAVNFDQGKMTSSDPEGYMRYGLGPLRPALPEGSGWMDGAAELAMTPHDLAKWDISIIDQSLLQPSSYKKFEQEVLLKSGVGTGYALGIENMVFPDDSAAVVVLTNQDAASASGSIAHGIARLLFKTQDKNTAMRTEQARKIFNMLQQGKINRSLFTSDANAYFSSQALKDFKSSLSPLGKPTSFMQTAQRLRGGMLERVFRVELPNRTLRVWTYQKPDGKLEQYQIAPMR